MNQPPLRSPFIPSTEFQQVRDQGLWFAFRGRALLVLDGFTVPRSLRATGLQAIRTQFLGHLRGEACLSAELSADAAPPSGASFQELRALYHKLPEPLMA